jgi:transcriptional regulator with XRE-family HTH domain
MKLKTLRKNLKLTQKQVAKEIGLNVETYANYEVGRREPDNKMLVKLADFFNVSLDELLGRECKMINVNFLEKEQKSIVEAVMQLNRENLLKVEAYTLSKLEDQNK